MESQRNDIGQFCQLAEQRVCRRTRTAALRGKQFHHHRFARRRCLCSSHGGKAENRHCADQANRNGSLVFAHHEKESVVKVIPIGRGGPTHFVRGSYCALPRITLDSWVISEPLSPRRLPSESLP